MKNILKTLINNINHATHIRIIPNLHVGKEELLLLQHISDKNFGK